MINKTELLLPRSLQSSGGRIQAIMIWRHIHIEEPELRAMEAHKRAIHPVRLGGGRGVPEVSQIKE